jgi:hypothetical protein
VTLAKCMRGAIARAVRAGMLLCLALAACAGVRTRASDAFERGDFLLAAQLYDSMVRADPEDQEALAWRSEARRQALAAMIAAVRQARQGGREADQRLGAAIARRREWDEPLDEPLVAAFDGEIDFASRSLRRRVAGAIDTDQPLHAEAVLREADQLLRELEPLRRELVAAVVRAGAASCQRLHAAAGSPYFAVLLARYCQRYGAAPPPTEPLPDLLSEPVFEGAIAGATGAQVDELRHRIRDEVMLSIWYSPSARSPLRVVLGGVVTVGFSERRVALEVPWTEMVPYTVTESVQVPYQEPYTDTETYSEQVPYTSYQSESYPCGATTCTRSMPVTEYRTEMRTRTVTKYRTAYRSEQRTETRYRPEPRVFHYEADEHTGRYGAEIRATVDFRQVPPLAVVQEQKDERRGLLHDVRFEPAHVAPSRPNLLLAEEWYERQVDGFVHRLHDALAAAWNDRFCALESYDVEPAARCAYGGQKLPPGAVHALAGVLGDDAALLPEALARPSVVP